MDNATPHRAKLTKSCFKIRQLREVDHPPYSPDLAPSDFDLFGKLNGQMAGREFESTDNFLATIRRLATAISREELESVFQEWERRLEECIRIGGEYIS
jgi:histone-lysine N-methyltransferase SETMAR